MLPSCPPHPILVPVAEPNATNAANATSATNATTTTATAIHQTVQTTDIVAYSMSFDLNRTQERLDKYLPKPMFKGTAIPAIRFTPGAIGYRMSMKEVLTKGLTETNSSLIAVFDDDFRVSKHFASRWAQLTTNPTTCYHDTLANGGVFVMGFSGKTPTLRQEMRDCAGEMTHDNGLCIDASQWSMGSFANIFSRPAAEFALQWLEKTYDERPFDWLWQDLVLLGYPVRGPLSPIFTADCAGTSSVSGKKVSVQKRHQLHMWGPVMDFLPPPGK